MASKHSVGPYPPTAADKQRAAEYQAEDDARMLLCARKIQKDPQRLKAAKEWARKRAEELKGVTGK